MSINAVMMQCGHAANARNESDEPVCAICIGIHPGAELPSESAPDLSGRTARCSCRNTAPSSAKLPFFEYLGPNSERALHICKHCRTYDRVHDMPNRTKCRNFEPIGAYEYDSYYCGCRGWD